MRMKAIKGLRAAARWIQRVLAVRLPMEAACGLRTRNPRN